MVENFSKDNYEYIQGPIDAHLRHPNHKESEEDLITSAEKAKRLNQERPISGITTAKGGPMSGAHIEDSEEDNEEYSQHEQSIDNS